MVNEEPYLMLSGIQHFQFCRRQWALIHIEQQWEENARTIEGRDLHRNVDQPFTREKRGDRIIARAMPIKSDELGLSGTCDVVEFHRDSRGVEIYGFEGKYRACPVEYKRGKPKVSDADRLQLTAQAMCLEEMLLCEVDVGYLYYHEIRHRIEVPVTEELRRKVKVIASEMQEYYRNRHTPKVKVGPHCRSCSLQHRCMPELMNKRSVQRYIEGLIRE